MVGFARHRAFGLVSRLTFTVSTRFRRRFVHFTIPFSRITGTALFPVLRTVINIVAALIVSALIVSARLAIRMMRPLRLAKLVQQNPLPPPQNLRSR